MHDGDEETYGTDYFDDKEACMLLTDVYYALKYNVDVETMEGNLKSRIRTRESVKNEIEEWLVETDVLDRFKIEEQKKIFRFLYGKRGGKLLYKLYDEYDGYDFESFFEHFEKLIALLKKEYVEFENDYEAEGE
jgi:hypothetical protein